MIIGAYQFEGSGNISNNFETMRNAIIQASLQNVRLLVFHECALTGYPPLKISNAKEIDYSLVADCMSNFQRLSEQYDMFLAVGSTTKRESGIYNSMQVFSPYGEKLHSYDKRALWGWDCENFTKGYDTGIYEIDGIKIGVRICFEVRFPEYFRELYKEHVDLCVVSFCDVMDSDCIDRYELIKSHLRTRAVENVMTILSVNDISPFQTAPTAVIDIDGNVVKELERNINGLLVYDFNIPQKHFAAQGRIVVSNKLLNN